MRSATSRTQRLSGSAACRHRALQRHNAARDQPSSRCPRSLFFRGGFGGEVAKTTTKKEYLTDALE
jgi:hypothetical protein